MRDTFADNRFGGTEPSFITVYDSVTQEEPNLIPLASGGFLLVWIESRSIKAQLFDRDGGRVGDQFFIAGPTYSPAHPSVTPLGSGGFVASWYDSGRTSDDDSVTGIRARIFDATGTAVGGDFPVNTTTMRSQQQASVSALAGGGFVVSWTDTNLSGIRAQLSTRRESAWVSNSASRRALQATNIFPSPRAFRTADS